MHISRQVFWNVNKKQCSVGLGTQIAAEDSSRMRNTSICLIGQQACVTSRNHSFKILTTAPRLKYKTHSEEAGGGIAELQHNAEGRAQQLSKTPLVMNRGRLWQALQQGRSLHRAGGSVCSNSCDAEQPKGCGRLKRVCSEQVSKQVIHFQHYVPVVKGISQW